MTRILPDCTVCAWSLPVRVGFADQDEADRYYREQVAPHIEATGHPVRVLVITKTEAWWSGGERTSYLFSPVKEGGPAPDPAQPDQ